nr:hypothetical protein [Tanacetum cinerariifolium]
DNKHVNDLLTAELERYKSQERVLNKLKHDEKASTSYEYSQEIKSLKHTLFEYLKEKESFEQKITILKDDLQKEESRNIDRELALEKEAQQLKPNLYDGSVIGKSDVSVVPDSENTLMHAEEMQTDEPTHSGTTIVEVLKELPKVSMGMWGFEHTKACFRDDIIPFVKSLKELFTSFDQCLIDEVTEVQKIFKQMEMVVEQHCAEKTEFQTKMENVLKENDRLLTHALSVEIVNIVVNDCMNVNCLNEDACEHCVTTESELKIDFIKKEYYETKVEKEVEELETLNLELDHKVTKLAAKNNHLKQTYKQLFDSIKSSRVQSKEQCDDLINKVNLKSVEVADLNARLQEKVLVITALKEQLKGKAVLTKAVFLNPIDPALLQVDVVPLVPKLRKNKTA